MSATVDLLNDVATRLQASGLKATVEYPGFILIPHATREGLWWSCGTANAQWGCDLTSADGEAFDYVELDLPSTSTDAAGIAAALVTVREGTHNG